MTTDPLIKLDEQSPPRHRMPWLLMASLAFNAVLIGGLIGAFFRYGSPTLNAYAMGTSGNLGNYVATLPSERRTVVLRAAADRRAVVAQQRRVVRQARDEAHTAMTAEPFDKPAFLTAQTRLVDAEHVLRLAQRDMLAEIAGALSPSERKAYPKWRGPGRQPANEPAMAPTAKP